MLPSVQKTFSLFLPDPPDRVGAPPSILSQFLEVVDQVDAEEELIPRCSVVVALVVPRVGSSGRSMIVEPMYFVAYSVFSVYLPGMPVR